jgi:hypothetical protein
VKLPAQTRFVTHLRCHPRAAHRRSHRHGHSQGRQKLRERARFGSAPRVSGWISTSSGKAVDHQPIWILTAPDDGRKAFSLAATARTRPDGSWTTTLPPGPSRLVKAVFAGTGSLESSSSAVGHIFVPAAISMSVSPNRTHWGGTVAINGHLRGGYVPAAGELVVLKIGWRGGSTEIGHLYTKRDGAFHSTYTFLRGNGSETYRMWAATAVESDYPYAPNRSRAERITVNP